MLHNEKGAALAMVIIILCVFSILGAAFLSISLSDSRHAVWNEKKEQAYYLARSGADATARWMLNTCSKNAADPINKLPTENMLGQGSFKVNVTRDSLSPKVIRIACNAKIDSNPGVPEATGYSEVTLKEFSDVFSGQPFKNTIYADEELFMNGNITVGGTVQAGINIRATRNTTYVAEPIGKVQYPPVKVPALDAGTLSSMTINSSGYYGSIIANSGTLTINLGGSPMQVAADIIDVKKIVINGNGELSLFIINSLNAREIMNTVPKNLTIYMSPGTVFNLNGNAGGSPFNGYIYGPEALVKINGTPQIKGAIIAKNASVLGTSDIAYDSLNAPDRKTEDLYIQRFEIKSWIK